MQWDVTMTWDKQSSYVFRLPAQLSHALHEKGYNRARVTVTDEGILLKPYVGEVAERSRASIALPEWE